MMVVQARLSGSNHDNRIHFFHDDCILMVSRLIACHQVIKGVLAVLSWSHAVRCEIFLLCDDVRY
jgi:hypothetical protein